MPLTFLHTADWQLGKPFASVADPGKRTKLQQARVDAVHAIAPLAVSTGAQFVLVAGDLFDSPTASRPTVVAACDAIGRIPVPVYVIPGNHDHGGSGAIWDQPFFQDAAQQRAPNLQVLRHAVPLEREDALLFPCPLERRQSATDPTTWLRRIPEPFEADPRPRIVLAHGSVQGFSSSATDDGDPGGGTPNLLALDQLHDGAYDYVALGDWHGVKQCTPNAWYSGAIEQDRHSRGADYRSGVVLAVTVARGAPPQVRQEAVGQVRWQQWEHHLAGEGALAQFRTELEQVVGARVDKDVLQLVLTGTLSIGDMEQLRGWLEAMEASVLRLELENRVAAEASNEEIRELVNGAEHPVIAAVADTLLRQAHREGGEGAVARVALQELMLLVRGGSAGTHGGAR